MTPLLPAPRIAGLLMPGPYVTIEPRRSCSLPKDWRWYGHVYEWAIVIQGGRWFLVFDQAAVGQVMAQHAGPRQLTLPLAG